MKPDITFAAISPPPSLAESMMRYAESWRQATA
jgi:hypothetical protein